MQHKIPGRAIFPDRFHYKGERLTGIQNHPVTGYKFIGYVPWEKLRYIFKPVRLMNVPDPPCPDIHEYYGAVFICYPGGGQAVFQIIKVNGGTIVGIKKSSP